MNLTENKVPAEWNVSDVILDLYEIKDIHEGGGMGLVYRVHHRGWNMDLAVKSPRAKFFQTEAQKADFTRECETWIKLGLHPHIVSCHYVRTLGGIPRVFAEYMEAGSLKDWIDSRKLYEGGPQEALKRILDVSIQMVWGLDYAHEHGLVHQDVKPANVLMTPDGTAKISDFGLAKARARTAEITSTDPTKSVLVSSGWMTPQYCSPEQANGQSLSRKTDIWSWAVSVMEMFVGEVCWQSGTAARELLEQSDELRADGIGLPDIPDGVRELLRQCFAPEPEQRHKSIGECAETLKAICEQTAGQTYVREAPRVAELLADGLNNKAVSLLDLGKTEEAEKILERTLEQHPGHLQATYNLGLKRWHTARGTDTDLLTALRQVQQNHPSDAVVRHLLGLVHLERGDAESALAVLNEAKEFADSADVRAAIGAANQLFPHAPKCVRVFEGHTQPITAVALSPDGRWAFSGSWDGRSPNSFRFWDVTNGTCLRTFQHGKSTSFNSRVALSVDGSTALATNDKAILVWSTATGDCLRKFEGHSTLVTCVAITADGRYAVSGSMDKTLRMWEVASGRCLRVFEGHTNTVRSVVLSVDGNFMLSASERSWGQTAPTLRHWEVATGRCIQTFGKGFEDMDCVSLTHDGRRALSCGQKTVRLWDVASGSCERDFGKDMLKPILLSGDGRWVVSGAPHAALRLWDVATGRCLRTFEADAFADPLALSGDAGWALSGHGDGTLRLWDLGTHHDLTKRIYAPPAVCRASGVAEVKQAKTIYDELLRSAENTLAAKQYAKCRELILQARSVPGYERAREALDLSRKLGRRGVRKTCRGSWYSGRLGNDLLHVNWVAMDRVGRLALLGCHYRMEIWDLVSRRLVKLISTPRGVVKAAALSADGRWALSCATDREYPENSNPLRQLREGPVVSERLCVWSLPEGDCVRCLEGHTGEISSVAISADGKIGISVSEADKTLRLWDLASGCCLESIECEFDPVRMLVLSPDAQWALSLSNEGAINQLLLTLAGASAGEFEGCRGNIKSIAISTNGRLAMTGNSKGLLQLWDITTAQCLRSFEGHTNAVNAVALSADGRCALSASSDGTLRLWDLLAGRCLQTIEKEGQAIKVLALSADAHLALSDGVECGLALWEIDWDYEFPETAPWDAGAAPLVEIFLTKHCPSHKDRYTRVGKPAWQEEDFQHLINELQYQGYGWLQPEGIRRKLEEIASAWDEPGRARARLPRIERWREFLRQLQKESPDLGIQVYD